jgi:hypothetical protein
MSTRLNYQYFAPLEKDAERACRLTSETAAARQESAEDFFAAASAQEVLPNGYELRFAASPTMPERIETFISEESVCCPFFAFERWEDDGGELVVRILRPADEEAV